MDNKFNFEVFVVRSQFLAGVLMLCGHKLQGLDKDRDNDNKNVFYFNNSPELLKVYNNYNIIKKPLNNILKPYKK